MEEVGEDFESVDEAGAAAIEVGVAVEDEDAVILGGGEVVVAGEFEKAAGFVEGAGKIEAAGGNEKDFGLGGEDIGPSDVVAMAAGSGEAGDAAGEVDQLGGPVAGGHERIDPFDADDAGGRWEGARV